MLWPPDNNKHKGEYDDAKDDANNADAELEGSGSIRALIDGRLMKT